MDNYEGYTDASHCKLPSLQCSSFGWKRSCTLVMCSVCVWKGVFATHRVCLSAIVSYFNRFDSCILLSWSSSNVIIACFSVLLQERMYAEIHTKIILNIISSHLTTFSPNIFIHFPFCAPWGFGRWWHRRPCRSCWVSRSWPWDGESTKIQRPEMPVTNI